MLLINFIYILSRMDDLISLRFYHQGEFQSTKYVNGKENVIMNVEPDRFSYTVLMEHVKYDLEYSEIGGIYVSKGKKGGWNLVSNDADLSAVVKGVKDGDQVDFYLDNVVDNNIEPIKQMQPHVIIRPRQELFAGIYMYFFSILPSLFSIFTIVFCCCPVSSQTFKYGIYFFICL